LRLQFLLRFLDFLNCFFLLASLFLWAGRASGSGSSVPYSLPFSPSGAIPTSLCIYPSSLPRLLVLGLGGGGGGKTSISTTLLPGCTIPRPPPRPQPPRPPRPLLPDMNKTDCRSSDKKGKRHRIIIVQQVVGVVFVKKDSPEHNQHHRSEKVRGTHDEPLITKSDENCCKVVGSQKSGAKRHLSNVSPESMTAAPTTSPQARDTTCALMKLNSVDEKVVWTKVRESVVWTKVRERRR